VQGLTYEVIIVSLLDEMIGYSNSVLSGDTVACKKHKWACERFLKDLQRQGADNFPYIFSEEKGERFIKWMGFFKHTKGPLAGQLKKPEPIEKFIFGNIYGWVHKGTGYRRFRKAYWQVAKKNAKSQDLAITGLYGIAADGEPYAEVYVAATKKEQTRYVWGEADLIAKGCPWLDGKIKTKFYEPIMSKAILHQKSGSFFSRLSNEDKKKGDGANPHYGLIDEYHQHDTTEHYDTLSSGMKTRKQPLLFIITTAGRDLNYPCYREEYKYVSDILDPDCEVDNDRYFAMVNELDTDDEGNLIDDINDERCWPKANPIVTLSPEGMDAIRDEVKTAQDKPEKMVDVLTKTFNVWVNKGKSAYLNYPKWKVCSTSPARPLPDLTKFDCYVGVDLTSKIDLAAVAFVFDLKDGYEAILPDGSIFSMPPESVAILSHSFMPQATFDMKMKTGKFRYDLWRDQGWLTITPGEVMDDRFIAKYIDDEKRRNHYNAKILGYDMYNATQFANVMHDEYEFTPVVIRQGIPTLHEPTKTLREYAYGGKLIHDGSPVLNMAAKNAVTRSDHNLNMMLDKEKSFENIDPMAAAVDGFVFIVKKPETEDPSVYETRGMRSLA
jgi:phage terminase large subunit-like protein